MAMLLHSSYVQIPANLYTGVNANTFAVSLLIGLENVVKNMLTSLRAVTELQNPAIRERHWQQLMQVRIVL